MCQPEKIGFAKLIENVRDAILDWEYHDVEVRDFTYGAKLMMTAEDIKRHMKYNTVIENRAYFPWDD